MHLKYSETINLRKKGKSYREIAKTLDVSKSSVSRWCKDLKLSLSAQKVIENNCKHNKEILFLFNKLKHDRVQRENIEVREKSCKQVVNLTKYELLLIGAALYWAEGYKKQQKNPSPGVCFVNSDPDMIKLFLRFLREIIKAPEEKIRVCVQVHPNVSAEEAINFWSKITNIKREKFRISHQVSRASKRVRPFNALPYGTLKIDFHKRQDFFRIIGWIDGIIKKCS